MLHTEDIQCIIGAVVKGPHPIAGGDHDVATMTGMMNLASDIDGLGFRYLTTNFGMVKKEGIRTMMESQGIPWGGGDENTYLIVPIDFTNPQVIGDGPAEIGLSVEINLEQCQQDGLFTNPDKILRQVSAMSRRILMEVEKIIESSSVDTITTITSVFTKETHEDGAPGVAMVDIDSLSSRAQLSYFSRP